MRGRGGRHAAARGRRPRRGAAAALMLAAALAVAWVCTGGEAAAQAPPETPPAGAAPSSPQVLLRVQTAGGLGASAVPSPPAVSLYGDGALVIADPVTAPAPALPGLSTRTLDQESLARVLAAAEAARLAEGPYADEIDPDGQATVFTLRHGTEVITSQFSVLSPHEGDSPDVADRRAKAAVLLEQMRHVETFVGPAGASAAQPVVPQRLAMSVRPVLGGSDAAIKAWPAPAVALAAISEAGSCVVLDGTAAAATRDALAGQEAATPWQEDERLWRIFAAPLLPDQAGCPSDGSAPAPA